MNDLQESGKGWIAKLVVESIVQAVLNGLIAALLVGLVLFFLQAREERERELREERIADRLRASDLLQEVTTAVLDSIASGRRLLFALDMDDGSPGDGSGNAAGMGVQTGELLADYARSHIHLIALDAAVRDTFGEEVAAQWSQFLDCLHAAMIRRGDAKVTHSNPPPDQIGEQVPIGDCDQVAARLLGLMSERIYTNKRAQ